MHPTVPILSTGPFPPPPEDDHALLDAHIARAQAELLSLETAGASKVLQSAPYDPHMSRIPRVSAPIPTASPAQHTSATVSRAELNHIQQLCGQSFTLDAFAACHASAACSSFCLGDSFIQHSVEGKHVWLHAPADILRVATLNPKP